VGALECWIFETATWSQATKLPAANEHWTWGLIDLRFSNNSKYLFIEEPLLYVYEVGSWRQVKTLLVTGATTDAKIASSADNRLLALGSDVGTRLYEIGTWRSIRTLPSGNGQAQALAFASDGRLVAANSDASVSIWDLKSAHPPPRLTGQVGKVGALALSPDAKTLAVADMSEAIRLRNMATGRELFSLTGHETAVNALAFSPDGTVLASGGSDATVRLWRAPGLGEGGLRGSGEKK